MLNLTHSNNFTFSATTTSVPAPGAGISFSPPVNLLSELIHISFSLTTAAAGPNRFIVIAHNIGAGFIVDIATPDFAHAGGVTMGYIGGQGLGQPGLTPVNIAVFGLPIYPIQKGGDGITVSIRGAQAGDQLTAVKTVFKFWGIKV